MKQMSKKNIKKSIKLQGSAGKGAVCDDQIIALATAILTLTIASRSRCSMVNNWLAEKRKTKNFGRISIAFYVKLPSNISIKKGKWKTHICSSTTVGLCKFWSFILAKKTSISTRHFSWANLFINSVTEKHKVVWKKKSESWFRENMEFLLARSSQEL